MDVTLVHEKKDLYALNQNAPRAIVLPGHAERAFFRLSDVCRKSRLVYGNVRDSGARGRRQGGWRSVALEHTHSSRIRH